MPTLLEKVNAIAGDNPLTQQEKDIVERADKKMTFAKSASTVIGAVGGYIMARKNSMSPAARVLSFVGLGFVGRQIGTLFGTAAALMTMKELPNPPKVFNLIEAATEQGRKNRNLPHQVPRSYTAGIYKRVDQHGETENSRPSFEHNRVRHQTSSPSDADANQSYNNQSGNERTSAWARIRMGQKPDGTPISDGNGGKDGFEGTDDTRVRANRTSYNTHDQGKGKTDDRFERYGQEHRHMSVNKYGDLVE